MELNLSRYFYEKNRHHFGANLGGVDEKGESKVIGRIGVFVSMQSRSDADDFLNLYHNK